MLFFGQKCPMPAFKFVFSFAAIIVRFCKCCFYYLLDFSLPIFFHIFVQFDVKNTTHFLLTQAFWRIIIEVAFEQNSCTKAKNKNRFQNNSTLHWRRIGFTRSCRFFFYICEFFRNVEFVHNKKAPRFPLRGAFLILNQWWSCRILPPGPKNLHACILRA